MIFFFIPSVISISIELTRENFDEVVNNTDNKPVFLKLWATWCPHCKKFQPVWEELSNSEKLLNDVIFAEIECESNRELCYKFQGQNFPRIYWMDRKQNINVQYNGPRTYEHFTMFIHKQLNFPLIPVENLTEYQQKSNETTSFVFQIPIEDKSKITLSKSIATKFRHYESQFLLLNSDKPKLIALTSPERTVEYQGIWSESEISNFVKLNSLPFLTTFSAAAIKHSELEDLPIFIILNRTLSSSLIDLADQVASHFLVAKANCDNQAWICRYTSIDLNATVPQFVIFDRRNRIFWVDRENNKTNEDVLQWMNNVIKGTAKKEGPGRGFFGPMREREYEERAMGQEGGAKVQNIVFVVIILLAVASFAYDMVANRRPKNKKKEE
ncbi:Thioredoxin family protein [Histomonas meleagridis]|uniref:Thioredoxin family protein n=1 Tax=Histomonas meleagridis TaxID=135588 RepID=UPI00355AAC53|nr:Thioredoxin family protein [Histomonas meleagridis]KAH0802435.1 Thioredoxin family protein [Histomonas meleagridis]